MKSIDNLKKSIGNSMTKKMLIATIIMFMAFLTFTFISQKLLFEQMYHDKKSIDIEDNVKKFSKTLSNAKTEEEIMNNIYRFKNDYNTTMAIADIRNNIIITFKTELDSVNEENNKIIQEILNAIKYDVQTIGKLMSGEQITVSLNITGKTTEYLCSAVMNNGKMVLGFTSIQYINEAVGIINIFYKYFYVVAIIVVILFSIIYSKMITNPLRRISKVAMKMSTLDFDEKCEVKSYDEIGSLAYTLNFLSSNLEKALTSLREANIELQKDIDKKEQIENMRKEFIADVSHELKTPITLIKGYAEGIKDGIFSDAEQEGSLDVIIEECGKMNSLVKDMLQISSLENGIIDLRLEEFYIDGVVQNILKKLSYSIEEKNIIIKSELQKLKVVADIFKIEQVITNFLTNAIRYTNEDGIIFIKVKKNDEGVKVSFENTGENISEDNLEKIWDKFYKVDRGRKRKDGGTGLGLSIVKNIIELHDGKYGVENTKKGVKFYFILRDKNMIDEYE